MEPQRIFGMTPWVRRLFAANLLVFVLQETVLGARFLNAFGFAPLDAFAHPWTFVTYLFLHANLLHLAFNLLGLFVFGPKVEERLGQKTFLLYYLACGVALAYAWYYPDAEIFVFPLPTPIPARWLVVLAVAVNLALAFWPGANGVAYLAHLGGMGTGFLWLKARGWREDRGVGARPAPAAAPGVLVHPGPRVGRASAQPGRARRPTGGAPDRTQAEMDRVLEKISAHGLDSLTPAERKFLADMSRKMRDRD